MILDYAKSPLRRPRLCPLSLAILFLFGAACVGILPVTISRFFAWGIFLWGYGMFLMIASIVAWGIWYLFKGEAHG